MLYRATQEQGLEGIVSKRLTSRYVFGERTRNWLKFPHRHRRSYVVGVWRPQEGTSDRLAALLVGEGPDDGLGKPAGLSDHSTIPVATSSSQASIRPASSARRSHSSARRRSSRERLRSVMSRAIFEAPTILPALSRIGETQSETEITRPSLVCLTVS